MNVVERLSQLLVVCEYYSVLLASSLDHMPVDVHSLFLFLHRRFPNALLLFSLSIFSFTITAGAVAAIVERFIDVVVGIAVAILTARAADVLRFQSHSYLLRHSSLTLELSILP